MELHEDSGKQFEIFWFTEHTGQQCTAGTDQAGNGSSVMGIPPLNTSLVGKTNSARGMHNEEVLITLISHLGAGSQHYIFSVHYHMG